MLRLHGTSCAAMLLIVLFLTAPITPHACTFEAGDKVFDLGSLYNAAGYTMMSNGYQYRFDICNSCDNQCRTGPFASCSSQAPGYQYSFASKCKTMGNVNDVIIRTHGQDWVPGVPCSADLCVGYTGGEPCSPTRSRSLLFALSCAPNANPPSSIMETGLGTCEYLVTWKHPAACGQQVSWRWQYTVDLIAGLIALYFVGVWAYNVKVKGMESNMEAVPHIELLREIPPLVLDGLSYSKLLLLQLIAFMDEQIQKIRGGGNSAQGYERIPAGAGSA